jgi:hypothetical protein
MRLCAFLIPALDGCGWLASRSGRFTSEGHPGRSRPFSLRHLSSLVLSFLLHLRLHLSIIYKRQVNPQSRSRHCATAIGIEPRSPSP